MRAGQRGASTRDTYVEAHRRAASTFFRWLVAEGVIERSPMERVERIKAERRQIVILQPAEMDALMRTAATAELGARDRAMIALAYDTGLRAGELVGIRLEDLDLAAGTCVVRGKTGEGMVPLSMECRAELVAYLRERPRMFPWADEGLLFPGRRGRPLQPNGVRLMLRRVTRRAGISKRVYPHLLRHSFGTQYLRGGGDVSRLQRILRHKTDAATRLYLHLVDDDVRAQHAVASPLVQLHRQAADISRRVSSRDG